MPEAVGKQARKMAGKCEENDKEKQTMYNMAQGTLSIFLKHIKLDYLD